MAKSLTQVIEDKERMKYFWQTMEKITNYYNSMRGTYSSSAIITSSTCANSINNQLRSGIYSNTLATTNDIFPRARRVYARTYTNR